ncbi:conserved oligomeric Golgi complex subunit 1 isoform X1 [Latimeria chalumnae]|uniref:Conserved oligomeric Golgi complex subunit 1 n=1 Tax=Latimeria chalumnae TaxID=7897 RepID=H3BGM4_LATCH
MAAVPAQNLRVAEIRDPAALFERYSAEEIRGVERRVRAEIEQKKEELRQMVGERYRDLIEAADTISEMRQCSERVVEAVQEMYQYCSKLKRGQGAPAGRGRAQPPLHCKEKFYCTAAQTKLLLEIPERIWSSMETSQYLHATQLYLLCCHLHTLLQLDSTGSHYSPILARFPILIRQLAAAGHFRSTILQECKSLLKGRAVSDQSIAEALCSIMLLEGSSPRQALTDFLLARKAAIQQLLNQHHHSAGIKAQVCSLVELLATTLYQAHALFYTSPEGKVQDTQLTSGLLFTTLETVTGQAAVPGKGMAFLKEEMKSDIWFKYMPSSVVDFQPALRSLAHPINQDYLRDTLQQWIHMCKEDIKCGISNLLVYVKSLKGLAGIRDAVWELLTSNSIRQNWDTVCNRLLDKPLSFWDDFLQQLFLDRLTSVTKEGLEAISNSSKQLLVLALQEFETKSSPVGRPVQFEYDVTLFLWSESASDLLSDAAWVSVASRSHFTKSGLSMKAQALTPCIQNFCSALDSKLRVRLDDLLSYLPPETPAAKDGPSDSPGPQPKTSAFDRYADANSVEEMLRSQCLSCIRCVLDCVREELGAAEGRLKGCKYSQDNCSLNAVLFMARLCRPLGELCPHLKQCILGKSGSSSDPVVREPRSVKKLGKGKSQEVNPAQAKWQELKEQLLQQSTEAYLIWSSTVSKALIHSFNQSLHSNTAGSVLATATNWDEIEIQEETESGSSVTSKIRLPVQPSWYVQLLLFHLCQEVNRVGGHALPKVTVQELLKSCMDEVIAGYEKLALSDQEQNKGEGKFPMTQNRALQLLFDLRYLSSVLTARNEDGKSSRNQQDSRIQQAADFLESYIDPFDLDVFMPHLNSNLNRQSQRTSVLFGLLAGTEKQYTSRSTSFSSQEAHNILPLASSQIRFGLLPLSATSSRKSKTAARNAEVSKHQVNPSTTLVVEEENFRPGSMFRQLASQDDETTTSSLFKLGWLSSMTK